MEKEDTDMERQKFRTKTIVLDYDWREFVVFNIEINVCEYTYIHSLAPPTEKVWEWQHLNSNKHS